MIGAAARRLAARCRERWRILDVRSKRWIETWGLAIAAVLCLGVSVLGAPTFWTAYHDQGRWGTFTAATRDCEPRLGCTWVGTFVSDDGRLHLAGAEFTGHVDHAGDRARAQAVGDANELYPSHDSPWLLLAGDAFSLGYLTWWVRAGRWRGTREVQRARTHG